MNYSTIIHNNNTYIIINADIAIVDNNKSPTNNVAKVYNKLPRVIKEIKSYNTFVKTLKKFLVDKYYYNVNDYHAEIWQS